MPESRLFTFLALRTRLSGRVRRVIPLLLVSLPTLGFVLTAGAPPSDATCLAPIAEQTVASSGSDGGDGIGGTGFEPDGIGGTGVVGMDREQLDRVRATGFSGGSRDFELSIYGTLTGLDGLCVDGLRVELPEDAVIERREGGPKLDPEQLRVGEVVSITARSTSGGIRAYHVSLRPALAGPVDEIQPAEERLSVMGRVIELVPDALIEDESQPGSTSLMSIRQGDFLIVHGLLASDGRLLASYILRTTAPEMGLVRGVATWRSGLWWVGGLPVERKSGGAAVNARWVVARGRWDLESGRLTRAQLQPDAALSPRARYVFVETLVRTGARPFSAAGVEIVASARVTQLIHALAPDTRLWIGGEIEANGGVHMRQLRVAPRHSLSQLVDAKSVSNRDTVDLLPGAHPIAPTALDRNETSAPIQLGRWAGRAVDAARPGLIVR